MLTGRRRGYTHLCLQTASSNHKLRSPLGRFPPQQFRKKWITYSWAAEICGGQRERTRRHGRPGATPLSPSDCWARSGPVEFDLPRRKHSQTQSDQRDLRLPKISHERCTSRCHPLSLSLWTEGLESHELGRAPARAADVAVTRGFWTLTRYPCDIKSIGRNSSKPAESTVEVSTSSGPCPDLTTIPHALHPDRLPTLFTLFL